MQAWVESLLELQAVDVKSAKIQELLNAIPGEAEKIKAVFAAETVAAEEAKKALQAVTLKIRDLEGQIQTYRKQKDDFQSKTALIKNNDEYRAALLQIELCGKQISECENAQLEAMEQQEQAQAFLERKNIELNEAKQRAQGMMNDLKVRLENGQKSLAALQEQRPALAAKVEPQLLARYERLRTAKRNVPTRECVVPVIDGACDRCHMTVTDQMRVTIIRGEYVTCAYCGAMLYHQD